MSCTSEWVRRAAVKAGGRALHPFLLWNCLPRAGASEPHAAPAAGAPGGGCPPRPGILREAPPRAQGRGAPRRRGRRR
uniref:Uncharacterized protein n=1 Tax=Tetraselmis sp. GSL018 TaxID=582737 RepID=A0A061RRF9_9CHLO